MTLFSRRRGFTLIEVLFAFALLTVSTFMLYQLLTRGSATAVSGIWRGTSQKRLQSAAERLRKAAEGASYPSVLTPEYNVLDRAEDHYVVVGAADKDDVGLLLELAGGELGGEGKTYRCIGPGRSDGSDGSGTFAAGDQLVFAATNCSPGRERIAGLPDQEGKATHYIFWLTNHRRVNGDHFAGIADLYYAEVVTEYANTAAMGSDTSIPVDGHPLGASSIPSDGKLLVADVNVVGIRVLDIDQNQVSATVDEEQRPTVEIAIRLVDPAGGKATLNKVVAVQPNTGVRFE
jgi:prepilin-type N-terminal cleavage/methylation domain-containing protein